MTIEELKLTNAIDTLIKEAKSTFIKEDSEYANSHHLNSEECYWNNQCTKSKIEAYEEILKLLHKKEDNFDVKKAMKIMEIRNECVKLVQEQLLKFCKEEKIELPTYYAY